MRTTSNTKLVTSAAGARQCRAASAPSAEQHGIRHPPFVSHHCTLNGFIAGGLAYFCDYEDAYESDSNSLLRMLPWLADVVRRDPQWPAKAVASLQRKQLLGAARWEGMQFNGSYDWDTVRSCIRQVAGPSGEIRTGPHPYAAEHDQVVTPASMESEARTRAIHSALRSEEDTEAAMATRVAWQLSKCVRWAQEEWLTSTNDAASNVLYGMLSERYPVLALADVFDEKHQWQPEEFAFVVDFDAEVVSYLQFTEHPTSGHPFSCWEPVSCASLRAPAELMDMADEMKLYAWEDGHVPESNMWFSTEERSLRLRALERWQRLAGSARRSLEASTCAVNSARPPGFPLLTNREGEVFDSNVDMSRLPDDYQPSSQALGSDCHPTPSSSADGEPIPWGELAPSTDPLTLDDHLLDTAGSTSPPVNNHLKQQIRDHKRLSNQQLSNADLAVEFGLSESKVQRITRGLPPKLRNAPNRH